MEAEAHAMLAFLRTYLKEPRLELHSDTPLLSSGLLDSFALLDVLGELERVTGHRIPVGRISPEDFETVEKMLEAAQRAPGK